MQSAIINPAARTAVPQTAAPLLTDTAVRFRTKLLAWLTTRIVEVSEVSQKAGAMSHAQLEERAAAIAERFFGALESHGWRYARGEGDSGDCVGAHRREDGSLRFAFADGGVVTLPAVPRGCEAYLLAATACELETTNRQLRLENTRLRAAAADRVTHYVRDARGDIVVEEITSSRGSAGATPANAKPGGRQASGRRRLTPADAR